MDFQKKVTVVTAARCDVEGSLRQAVDLRGKRG
ncbi:hypothetical protein Dcar01_01630 [Deinococcus carri]|uniref:Transposase n=1 Tax=Deinococcus carri TaxID=1211323 RepID=A0ABP9W707_9DEIO